MADIAAVVIRILQWVGAPVTRQFQYLCCFSINITSLRNEANELEVRAQDLQERVDRARNDLRVISPVVETWLQKSTDIKYEKDQILEEVPKVESGCLKLGARFSLSKRAKKTTQRLKELQDRCKFQPDDISQPAPAAATQPIPSGMTYEFESRKQIEEDIMAALRGGDVNMMGIHGMGGLGKTTMALKIMNRARDEHLFDEIVIAVVSQQVDELKIQLDIGGTLGLELKNETPQARVQKLHTRLRGTKRILLVLDDVWDSLVPENIGIPSGYKECTILLTSRNHDVLGAMDVQKIFGMEVLSGEDSWIMFRGRVGTCVDNTELKSIAKKVVNECRGLPLALTTVGAALKDEVDVDKWKNAVRQLEKGDPDILGYSAKVYNPLKLSYDVLEPKYQYVFLLCCLYPEDADIPLEHLTYFCMELLRMFEGGIGNVEEARNRMRALTKVLKSRSLLLDSKNGDEYVRMHDVVRDVCIFIAKQKGYIGDNNCSWISSIHRSKLPMGLAVPNLRLLFFRAHEYLKGEFTLDNSFLEGIRDLSVICIERYSLVSLPHATQLLRNLNTLLLDSCRRVETLSVVGELVNLEILICRRCYSIEELPLEIKGLNRLKVLDLTECWKLQRIGRGIVSSLVGLEELKMLRSFKKWEGEDREERENAGVRELEALTKLRWLEIEIQDPALAAQNIRLSSNLDRFTIKFECEAHWKSNFDEYLSKKKMRLNWEGAAGLGDWIEMQLLRDTECLYLSGNGANKVELTKIDKMKMLELGRCESMKDVCATVLPSIDHLLLFKLPKLDGVSLNCFPNVKVIKLYDLPALKQLWKSSQSDLGKEFLPQLEVLEINNCEMMEGVFIMWKGEDGNENNTCHPITIIFPKLKELYLINLPNLISLCQGIEGIEFPLLRKMVIRECLKMKGMVANGVTSNENNSADTHCHLFCESQQGATCLGDWIEMRLLRDTECLYLSGNAANNVDMTKIENINMLVLDKCVSLKNVVTTSMDHGVSLNCFQNLKELSLTGLPALKQLWKSSSPNELGKEFLPQLEVLEINNCEMMEGVFIMWKGEDGNENNTCHPITIMFPKLKELRLYDLPNLISLCQGIEGIEFPLLSKIQIERCGKMKGMVANGVTSNENNSAHTHCNLFCQQVSFGCLKELVIDRNPFCSDTIHVSLFNGLEVLRISKCAGSLSLFTSSMAGNLVNLKILIILECDEMVEVIKDDDEEKAMSATALLFPKLHTLDLYCLPKLVSFCGWKCDVEFPSLRKLGIFRRCPSMKNFALGSLAAPNLESFATDLNNYLLQLPFNSTLKKLSVWRNENPLNCYEIHGSVFDRLEELTIFEYRGSMSLFSCSITGSLVNLTTLTIRWCNKMVKVIEEKEEEVSAAAQTTLLFPKLKELHLLDLPELVSFCEWKCDVELPSLRQLKIYRCHNMKSFTSGLLTTPKLKSVDHQDFGGVKDVNEFLQQQYNFNRIEELRYSNRIEKIQAEEAEKKKKKGGEEEQESRVEIEEETSEVATLKEAAAAE